MKGNLSSYSVSTDTSQRTLKTLEDKVSKNGYMIATYEASESIQLKTSFVSFKNGQVIALLHLPIYKIQTALFAYKYEALPITTKENETTLYIEAERPILAISLKNDLHIEFSSFELEHNCELFKSTYYCRDKSVLQKSADSGCLTALYKRQKSKINKLCPIQLFSKDEHIIQINSTTFLTYSKGKTNAYVSCSKDGKKTFENNYDIKARAFNYITLHASCVFNFGHTILSTNLPLNADIYARITGVNLYLTDLVDFGEEDMAEFTAFVKRDAISTHYNIRIEDIRKKISAD